MPEEQLSICSTRAKRLAHRLAKKEQRTVSQIVERALDEYAKSSPATPKESDGEFWRRMARENSTDIDLQALIDLNRKPPLAKWIGSYLFLNTQPQK